jgi:Tfp pilus assembly protein PilO
MKETAKRNISLILVIVFFGAAMIVFFTLSWPNLTKVFDLNSVLNESKKEYENQNQSLQLAKSIIEQYKNLNDVNQAVSLTMPKTDEIYNIIVQLNKIAESSGMSIEGLSLKEVINNNELDDSNNRQNLVKPYRTISINTSLNGSYESFKTWLELVETNIRLMDVKSVSFEGVNLSSNKSINNFFNFNVNLDIYYQL